MADSVQWLSQSDYTICIILLISNGFDQFYRLNMPQGQLSTNQGFTPSLKTIRALWCGVILTVTKSQ